MSVWRRAAPRRDGLEVALEISELERAHARLSDDELRERGARYRRAVRVGTPVSELRAELLALLRELAHRELGVRASEGQLAAACAAHAGALAELAPGEGKSLACVFAVALAALEGRGAHVLVADPYLARRGALRAAPLLEALELRVAVLEQGPEGAERRKHYAADVVFTTADEIARDALADSLSCAANDCVQSRLHAAIVDDAEALWLEPAGSRWVARDPARAGVPPLAAIARARVPELYASWGGVSSIAGPLAALLAPVLEVVVIPPLRPSGRLDHPDALFTHAAARDRAIVEATSRAHMEGRPVLLVTDSAAQSAQLAERLRAASVRCSVLEARPGEVNAAVLERAGSPGAVTLAIRGVDRGTAIPLGRGVAALGGLCVIATSRPGIELADQVVRGFAGQRGAPGATRLLPEPRRPHQLRLRSPGCAAAPLARPARAGAALRSGARARGSPPARSSRARALRSAAGIRGVLGVARTTAPHRRRASRDAARRVRASRARRRLVRACRPDRRAPARAGRARPGQRRVRRRGRGFLRGLSRRGGARICGGAR